LEQKSTMERVSGAILKTIFRIYKFIPLFQNLRSICSTVPFTPFSILFTVLSLFLYLFSYSFLEQILEQIRTDVYPRRGAGEW
jgi:hypothetical protein